MNYQLIIKKEKFMKIKYILFLFFAVLLNSCMEEELPVKPYPRGDVQVGTVEMSPKYINQIFYSFENNKVMKFNEYDVWDLAFRCFGENGFHILLNGAKFMEAADMGEVSFESVTSSKDAPFEYDSSNADYDNYAIGKWWNEESGKIISKNHVYIVNRGNNIANKKVGYVKMMITGYENNEYTIKFANLDGSNEYTVKIPRNDEYNFIYFNFSDGGKVLELEPKSNEWDIMFGKYIAFLTYDLGVLPYSVTGVLINHRYCSAASDTSMVFNNITFKDIENFQFSSRPDYIGHEWKTFNLSGESYAAKPEINYFLKDFNGFYWKFHFIDFYNDKGERGYPKFELKKL